jgi:hypothetical protein
MPKENEIEYRLIVLRGLNAMDITVNPKLALIAAPSERNAGKLTQIV